MLTIYHLNHSRSERIIWLAEELSIPYQLERFLREPSGLAPPALMKIQPLGKAPIIRDNDTVLIESGAIVEYIIARHGEGRLAVAPTASNYGRYLQWLHFAEGSAMSQLLQKYMLGLAGIDAGSPIGHMMNERTDVLVKFLENELEGRHYFAGDEFSAADIMMVFVITGFLKGILSLDFTSYPNLAAYLQRIEARPAYQKAMAIAA